MKQPVSLLVAEVDDCIGKIVGYQRRAGRRVADRIKRSRKGPAGMADLQQFGLPIPEDFAALYEHFNGVPSGGHLSFWESAVFLDAMWPDTALLKSWNEIIRLERQLRADRTIKVFRATLGVSYDLMPDMAENGEIPLVANLGPLSHRTFIAFDSTLAMLRSVCAAHEAGLIGYAAERMPFFGPFGRDVERNETLFDPKDLAGLIRKFNRRAEYWSMLAEGPVDWQEIPRKPPESGPLNLDPAVRAIVLGDMLKE